jgi:hypothetical protein
MKLNHDDLALIREALQELGVAQLDEAVTKRFADGDRAEVKAHLMKSNRAMILAALMSPAPQYEDTALGAGDTHGDLDAAH